MKGATLASRVAGIHFAAASLGIVTVAVAYSFGAGPVAFAGALAFLALAVLAASFTAARQLARPLESIATDTSLIARGHSEHVTPTGTVETRRLSAAINRMADELAEVIEELRSETDLREQILGSMREGVMLAGPAGALIYANQAGTQMFGRTRLDMMPPQLEVPGEHEFTIHHPRRLALRATSKKLGDGRTLAVIQDETERKRVELIRRDFVANASHELKTPVAGILVTAETVEQAMTHDSVLATRFARNLVREARRLSALVQDLLNLARLEEGRSGGDRVMLAHVVREEAEALSERIASKGLKLRLALDEEVAVAGVREDLALMVRNLMENAVLYTADGMLSAQLSDTGEGFRLTVSDTGAGIPITDLERIFERFYRVDRARSRDTGGTGLGLAIVRHVVEVHGGKVAVASELGKGSSFTVSLPYPPEPVSTDPASRARVGERAEAE
ncbi:MAG: HAMP domain-containing sensor histidine kinase [Actinomycetota bacterium]